MFDKTVRDGRRCSAARAYLSATVRARPNPTIVTGAHARRVLFDGQRAAGVAYEAEGVRKEATARREVVLCAGAIGTPQLLMLSGVGPATHLAEHAIELVSDLPAIGAGLKDHLDVVVNLETDGRGAIRDDLRGRLDQLRALPRYLTRRDGLFASNVAEGNGFARSRPDAERCDVQLHFIPALVVDHGSGDTQGKAGVSLHACNLYPESVGTVRLASRDPLAPPRIDPNYLASARDEAVMIAGVRLARRILSQPAFDAGRRGFVFPSEVGDDEEAIRRVVRDHAETIYHPAGTARMGRRGDERAGTDALGLVHGTRDLRVVDASLFPDLPGGNTNAPVIMVAERIVARGMRPGLTR